MFKCALTNRFKLPLLHTATGLHEKKFRSEYHNWSVQKLNREVTGLTLN